MEEGTRRMLAFIVMVMFVMMMLVPAVSENLAFSTWFLTLLVAAVVVPLVLVYAFRRSKRETETKKEMLTWRGLTEEEWIEDRDPDDFEGEID